MTNKPSAEFERVFAEAERLPAPSRRFFAKMNDQARTNAALAEPGAARDAYLEVTAKSGPAARPK